LVFIFIWDRIDGRQEHQDASTQIEATNRPCVVFSTAPREPDEAILEMGGTNSLMVLRCPGALAQLENIGNGPAVNIRYLMEHLVQDATVSGLTGYLVGVSPGETFLTPISRNAFMNVEWKILLTYESLSGHKSKTETTVKNLVLTHIKFE
jgi:hypothetical protein